MPEPSPIQCRFLLNDQQTSMLICPGFGSVAAFSGRNQGRDNARFAAKTDIGPLPPGTYYIVDRQPGGRIGWFRDMWDKHGWGTTDRTKWFMLMNPRTGDETIIDGVKRGQFRLHPMGPMRLSDGCITVVSPLTFDQLAQYIRSRGRTLSVPGSAMRAYGTVEVR